VQNLCENTVSPHASFLALSVLPQQAYTNIVNLRTLYPDVYSSDGGFYDAVNPTTPVGWDIAGWCSINP